MRLATPLLALFLVALVACGGDDYSPPAASATAPDASTQGARTPAAFRPIDGTVAAQNPASTEPFHVKANPDPPRGIAVVEDVRAGSHSEQGGWERIVFEMRGDLPEGDVLYATRQVAQCGSGAPVSLKGSAVLLVTFRGTQAHDDFGRLTVDATQLTGPGKAITEAKQVCDFEGLVEWAIGVHARQRFKVTLLTNPHRVVIDVKQ